MKTEFLKQFYKDLDKITLQSTLDDINSSIINVEEAVSVREITNLKKLTGYKNAYRIKIGNYRIGVFIENNIVEFARVIHRKDIYRVFP
ncbi:MAG: type II toxin-antitoxin system RelE/ParE family toxin [Bacteroidota bacterium]|jgi:mRNA interferase RelE/StbE|nr:type II toxin-antitoxin system RelE/ParE family toxin [Bacteroidota bacterium]MDO9613910.1 type II toxin-antitoxin system RelE/ParE family toxin [Bacteroidota bacterium]